MQPIPSSRGPHRIAPEAFDIDRFQPGSKTAIALNLAPGAPDTELPVFVVRGKRQGKTLVVNAGVHGDEFEGVRAVLELYSELDPDQMRGTLLAVPVANPAAFWHGTRLSPIDSANLARQFPGAQNGTVTEVIAFHLAHSVIARADFFLDLHSAGVKLLMPSMVGYDTNDARSVGAAMIFGAPVLWGHSEIGPGRTISFAASRKIPWLYTEARGAGRIDPQDLLMFKRGVMNLLNHLGIMPGEMKRQPVEHVLSGSGDLDFGVNARRQGFLLPRVELLESVTSGQELGSTVDLYGETVEKFFSPAAGVVGMIRAFPIIEPDDVVFLIAKHLK